MNLKNKIWKNFQQLIQKYFPCFSKRHKIFNRKTVKMLVTVAHQILNKLSKETIKL